MARCFYHPLGEQTSYTYDLAGRVLTEDHSDRGLTTTTYDNASNVMEINTPATQSFGGSITMDYDFNRLVSRLMPNSSGMDLYDIQYTYGYKGDGRNGAGRVVKVEQGQTFKIDDLRYDELGQSAEEVVSIDVPMQGVRMFTTRKFYDSFGRILQAGYPDGDKVDYQYNALGELSGINSTLGGVTQPIITAISYNGYGQISLLTYGNGTSTTYSYASGNTKKATTLMSSAVTGKEQGSTSPTTLLSRQYAYNKQGMVSTMDRSIAGSLLSQSSLVNYHDSYSYDAFGRLEGHQQLNGTTPQYDLTMSYNKAGGITFKDGNGNGFMNAQSLNYNLEYGYSPAKPHQLEHIWDADNAITTQFQYNTSGSITQIDDPSQGIPQEFYWNEAQQLTGVKNQQGVHHYIYDHQGERIMKSSLITSTVYLNDQVIDDVNNLDPYTVYVNPFYVVTGFMGGDRVSKHYYMNQQRVATDISINYDPNGNGGAEAREASPRANAQNLALVDLSKVLRALDQPELDTTALTLPRMESVYPELQPSSTTSTALTENITNRILFWYHPDYLGNVDLVTEKDGYAYEFFVYTPWGEEMHQWNANTFNFSSPYRFNGKELDPETGLAYYGARYYQNKIGVWLSVDRFANKYPNVSPYSFCYNNPQIFNDPTGDTIVNKAQSGTEEYIRLENGILNFKIKCPSAYAEMHAAPQLIEINFSDNNLISDLGRELNGNTTTNYLVENNTSILPQSLTRLVIENDEIFPEKIFNGIFEIKRGHDPSEWMTIYTRNQSIVEVQGFQITIDRHLSGSELNSTIGHEFGHSLFALQNPLLSYIWGLIQNNSHPNGRGHDKYNPSGHEAVYYGNQAR